MADIEAGTLLTFPIQGAACALAHVVYVQELPLGRYYHLAVLDTVLEAGPDGYTEHGDYLPRTHDLQGEERAPQAIDHLALTEEALLSSAPMIVGWREVERGDTVGYRTWVTLFHEEAERRGLVGRRGSEEHVEEEQVEGDEMAEEQEGQHDAPADESSEEEGTVVQVQRWHRTVFADSFATALLGFVEDFRRHDALRATTLGAYITGRYSAERGEEIEALVERLAEGDFSASEELAMYGDAAIEPLQNRLTPEPDPQFLEDVLLALTTIGTERSLETIAAIFDTYAAHGTPLSQAAERGYLNAVTMTGGGASLGTEERIEKITDPALADDLRTARAAIAEGEKGE